jgi:hypothetical protein
MSTQMLYSAHLGALKKAVRKEQAMPAPSAQRITRLLQTWSERKDVALEELLSLGHQVLRQPARRHMVEEPPGPPLQTTTEACLLLISSRRVNLKNSTRFFAVSAQLLRDFWWIPPAPAGTRSEEASPARLEASEGLAGAGNREDRGECK